MALQPTIMSRSLRQRIQFWSEGFLGLRGKDYDDFQENRHYFAMVKEVQLMQG